MYQAQILQGGKAPATLAHAAHIAHTLGGVGRVEEIDAAEGIYLIPVNDYNASRIEAGGLFSANIDGYTVVIDTP